MPLVGYNGEWETTYTSHWRALAAGQRPAAHHAALYDGLFVGGAYSSQFMTGLASWWAFCRSVWAIMR